MKENKFVTYLLLIIGLFVLVIFTKDYIYNISDNSSINEEKQTKIESLERELKSLSDKKEEIKSSTEIKRFDKGFTESELINYFHNYASESFTNSGSIIIKSLSLSPENKNDLGFMEQKINLNIGYTDSSAVTQLLDFLVSDESEYQFYIENYNFDLKGEELILPLKIFYK